MNFQDSKHTETNKQKKLKVLYLICMERIFNYGIFESQVKNLIVEISKQSKDNIYISLMILIPLVHIAKSGITVNFINNMGEIDRLKRELKKYNIDTIFYYVPLFRWTIYLKPIFFPIFVITALPAIAYVLGKYKYDIVHCRSYLSAFLAALLKQIGLKLKIIFDVRAPLPEQGVIAGRYKKRSLSYRIWKGIEKYIVKESDTIIGISKEHTKYIEKLYDTKRIVTINNTVEMENRVKVVKQIEEKTLLNIKSKKVIVYNGSLGLWNDPKIITQIFKKLKEFDKDLFLLFITNYNREKLCKILLNDNLSEEDFDIIKLPHKMVSKILSSCKYGIWPSRIEIEESDIEIAHKTVTGIKTFEYLSAGLPIIANEKMIAIKNLINENGIGIDFNLDDLDALMESYYQMEKNYIEIKKRCLSVAKKLADVKYHAKSYIKIYYSMAKPNPTKCCD